MLDALKASWDHLPKPPRLPPSMLKLTTRRAWLNLRPTFTYGDDRDKEQLAELRRARRKIERDEAWALKEAKMKALAERKRARKANANAKSKGFLRLDSTGKKTAAPAPAPLRPAPNGGVVRTRTTPVVSPAPSRRPTINTTRTAPTGARPANTSRKASGSSSPIAQRATQRAVAYGVPPAQYAGRPVAGLAALRPQPAPTMPTRKPTTGAARVVYRQVPARSPTQPMKTTTTRVPQVVRSQSYPIEVGPQRKR